MITGRVYDDYDSIALQVVNADDFEGDEFSKKFRAKSTGDMKKLMSCVGCYNHPNYLKIQLLCLYKNYRQSDWIFK